MSVHAVLGAGGAIANATVQALENRGLEARALSRKDADVRNVSQLTEALRGAEFAYLCVGLPYRSKLWRKHFPATMRAVLKACESNSTKLVFFDNAYMYGPPPLQKPITEDHPQKPSSIKGRARKATAELALSAHADGNVQVVIGRCADFYGPGGINSPFYINFLEFMLRAKAPQVAMPQGPVHAYAYTLDMGRALVELALKDDAYGEVWHLPVGPAVTVADMAGYFNASLGTDFKVSHIPDIALRMLALVNPLIREVYEMNYQYKSDYVFSDEKFRAAFPDFETTDYVTGVAEMVRFFSESKQD